MAYVTALQKGWLTENLQFQGILVYSSPSQTLGHTITVNNDIRGLIDSVNDGSTSAFMWEWFTTKPFADAGEVRFVSLIPPVVLSEEAISLA